jgi:3'(2'), 5'-bisphosphate nucleotidase
MLSKSDIEKIKVLLYEANNMAKYYRNKGLDISYKKDNSPVTNADIAISEYLVKELAHITPEIQIISEESTYNMPEQDLFWLIDPIDGTRGYIKGNNLYTVNIGLVSKNIPLYGFITIPETDMLYYTETPDLLKIERDGMEVSLPQKENLQAVISEVDHQIAMDIVAKHGITEYKYFPCSAKFCFIASGEADLYPRCGATMEWDTAAGGALINASGGTIVDFDGKIMSYGKENLVNKGFIAYSKRLKNSTFITHPEEPKATS